MAQKNYDNELQMLVEPMIEIDETIVKRLTFMRWLMETNPQAFNDGRVEGKSDGPVIDFIKEKAERQAKGQTVAA